MTPVETEPVAIEPTERRPSRRDDRGLDDFTRITWDASSRSTLNSGKLRWRSDAVHHLRVLAGQQGRMLPAPGRFAILASREFVWTVAVDLKKQNYMATFRAGVPTGRRRRGRLEIERPDGVCAVRPQRAAAPVRRRVVRPGESPAEPARGSTASPAGGPGDPTARRQDDMEDRDRRLPPGPAALLLLQHARYVAAAPACSSAAGRSTSIPTSVFWLGSTPTPAASTGGTATRPTRPRAENRFISYNGVRSRNRSAAGRLRVGDALLDQGGAVEPDVRHRPEPDEGPLGTTDQQGRAGLERRRRRRLSSAARSWRALDLKSRGLSWATRLPGGSLEGARAGTTRRRLPVDPQGRLRTRSGLWRRPADFPGRGPGFRRRRPRVDRRSPAGRIQPHDHRVSQAGRRRRRVARPRRRRPRDDVHHRFASPSFEASSRRSRSRVFSVSRGRPAPSSPIRTTSSIVPGTSRD